MSLDFNKSYVYVIAEADTNFVKIGVTGLDIKHRLSGIQNGNPRQLVVRHVEAARNHGMARRVELAVHARLAQYAQIGEWFRVDAGHAVSILKQEITNKDHWYDKPKPVHRFRPRTADEALAMARARQSRLNGLQCEGCGTQLTGVRKVYCGNPCHEHLIPRRGTQRWNKHAVGPVYVHPELDLLNQGAL